MRLDKGLASQDHPVAEVFCPAQKALGKRNFALLLLNDLLNCGQVKRRWSVSTAGIPYHKEVYAVLAAEFRPGDSLRLTQNGSDPLTGNRTTLADSLGVTGVTVVLRVTTQAGPDRIKLNV